MTPWTDWLLWGADRLVAGSVQGAGVAAVVWMVCRHATSLSPATRAFLWWLVSLKLAVSLLPLPSLAVPLLPATWSEPQAVILTAPMAPAAPVAVPSWMVAVMTCWVVAVSWHGTRLALAARRLRRIVRHATPLGDDAPLVDRLARRLGISPTPDVRVSADVEMPLVTGLFRATVLLPARAVEILTPAEWAMAICHELAHVRRRDLLLGWVPAMAERLFFFHPLARLAAREYALEREAACDALVLRAMDASPGDYGQVLLRLGVAGPTPSFTAGGASPSASVLKRRLAMLNDVTLARAHRWMLAVLALGVALTLVPFDLTAQTPRTQAAQSEVRKMEASLQETQQGMRALAEATKARLEAQRAAADARKRAVEEQKLAEKLKLAALQLTDRSLREQLRVLARQQEATERTLRELSLELDRLRHDLERTDRAFPVPPGSSPF